jgi:hypothetical protein
MVDDDDNEIYRDIQVYSSTTSEILKIRLWLVGYTRKDKSRGQAGKQRSCRVPKVCARIWGGSADNRSGGCLSAFSFTKIQVLPDGKRVVRAETQIL